MPTATPGATAYATTADPAAAERPRRRTAFALTAALVACLVLLALLSAGVGAYRIPLGDVLTSVQHRAGLGGAPLDRVGESVLWNVRLPRVVLALLVGGSLGCAGALMQGVFGNPLAEPGVIGISAGAAVGAVAAIGLGLSFLGDWTVTVCAFAARPDHRRLRLLPLPRRRPDRGRHPHPHRHRRQRLHAAPSSACSSSSRTAARSTRSPSGSSAPSPRPPGPRCSPYSPVPPRAC